MTWILRLAAAFALVISPVICTGEECQARQVLIQHGAELLSDAATTAEMPSGRLMPGSPSKTGGAGGIHTGWLESDSKEPSSDAAEAKASRSAPRDALFAIGMDSTNMDKVMSDIQSAIAGGGHSGNGPMWLRLHVAAGIIVFVAACIVMICRPPQSVPPSAEGDSGARHSGDRTAEVAGSQNKEVEDALAHTPFLLASALVSSKNQEKERRLLPNASVSTFASGPRSESVASVSSGDQASSAASHAQDAVDDSESQDSGVLGSVSEEAASLLVGDSAPSEDSGDDDPPVDKVCDTFEASGAYLSSPTTEANSKT